MADINLYTMVLNRVASVLFFDSSKYSPFSFRKKKEDFWRTMLPRAQNSTQHIIKQKLASRPPRDPISPNKVFTVPSIDALWLCILYYRMVPIATPGRVYFIREKTCGDRDEWMNGTYSHFSMCADLSKVFFRFFLCLVAYIYIGWGCDSGPETRWGNPPCVHDVLFGFGYIVCKWNEYIRKEWLRAMRLVSLYLGFTVSRLRAPRPPRRYIAEP